MKLVIIKKKSVVNQLLPKIRGNMGFEVHYSGAADRVDLTYLDDNKQIQTLHNVKVYGDKNGGCKDWLARGWGKILATFSDVAIEIQDKETSQVFYINTKSLGKKTVRSDSDDRVIEAAAKNLVRDVGVPESLPLAIDRKADVRKVRDALEICKTLGIDESNYSPVISTLANAIEKTVEFRNLPSHDKKWPNRSILSQVKYLTKKPDFNETMEFIAQLERNLQEYEEASWTK